MEYEYVFKIIMIGDANVGKTTLLYRYTEGVCERSSIQPTIGVEYVPKVIKLPSNDKYNNNNKYKPQRVKLAIWDTAGQERYRSIVRTYFRDAMGAIVMYDVTQKKSFENIKHWIELLRSECQQPVVIAVVGNKTDLEPFREVTYDEAQKVILNMDGIKIHFQVSALNPSDDLDEIFQCLTEHIYATVSSLSSHPRRVYNNKHEDYHLMRKKIEKKKNCCF